ncbi:hypothetical protein DNTS_010258, partial [Danionella cerebrum]
SQACKHIVIASTVSLLNKCAKCVGPEGPLKWIVCSSFWHASCFKKFYPMWSRYQSREISSEDDEPSDEDYVPQSESDSQSDSSANLTGSPLRCGPANLLASSSEALSDIADLSIPMSNEEVLRSREAPENSDSTVVCSSSDITFSSTPTEQRDEQ